MNNRAFIYCRVSRLGVARGRKAADGRCRQRPGHPHAEASVSASRMWVRALTPAKKVRACLHWSRASRFRFGTPMSMKSAMGAGRSSGRRRPARADTPTALDNGKL